ncbi:flagellar basal body rod protein FlgG [Niallia sp. NCCP-28]|uniref:flagellar basal body rod protein FlgG n=1 Tax=Niallia sp. NCCP-28 TaxID=2934712 RepID=UPI00203696B3|nr:flagellar basal body rod protein FlgG [Niallia sp. NCCP-28]GKU82477.1 flagellar basal-body rod protein FlgG [Niallia sp. NCCP-28]
MLRSLYSGVTGMKNFQTKLDVIGNNIANVNTYGFKKGRATFSDLISQTTAGATAPSTTTNAGGMNPKQIGLGSQVASVDTIATQGSMQTTGRTLDLSLSGEGYFVLAGPDANTQYYTRAGNFYLDADRNIVSSNGLKLQVTGGITGDNNGEPTSSGNVVGSTVIPTGAQSFSIGSNGIITYINENGETRQAGQILLAKVSNPEGLTKVGANMYQTSANSGGLSQPTTTQLGGLVFSGEDGTGAINSGYLEMSNVDLTDEFTEMIVGQRGFQSNSKIITTSDEILQELLNLKR